MLNQIFKLAVVSSVALFLRPRWKRLCACAFAILVAAYGHGEYLDFVAALPAGSDEAARGGEYMLIAFALKNMVVGCALVAAILPELRRGRPTRPRAPGDETAESDAAGMPSPKVVESARSNKTEEGDGFDFLRDGRKLSTRAERLIREKSSQ